MIVYHDHYKDGRFLLRHRHDDDARPHEHAEYGWTLDRAPRTFNAEGQRTPGESTPLEDL